MKYTVRKLELHRAISVEHVQPAGDGTLAIHECRSLVGRNNLEPEPRQHLAIDGEAGEIPPGKYLFTQGTETENRETWREAAEAVWLEAIWMGAEFKNDRILVRVLSEDSKSVFQIFREVIGEN